MLPGFDSRMNHRVWVEFIVGSHSFPKGFILCKDKNIACRFLLLSGVSFNCFKFSAVQEKYNLFIYIY